MPSRHGELQALCEEPLDVVDDVLIAGVLLHRARLAEHVHQAAVGVAVGDQPGHLRIAAKRGDVVDERRAGIERGARDVRLCVSIEICAPVRAPASPSITGSTRRSSSSADTGAAPGRVDSPPTSRICGSLAREHPAMLHGGIGLEEHPAV